MSPRAVIWGILGLFILCRPEFLYARQGLPETDASRILRLRILGATLVGYAVVRLVPFFEIPGLPESEFDIALMLMLMIGHVWVRYG
jgi:hypothetical protein